MRRTLAPKLRITAAALGCTTRKDLCARFHAANPATGFDLERSHKWMQGKAAPRSSRVYDDWALVLGTARSGAWIASCTVDAFIDEVSRLFEADAAMLRGIGASPAPHATHRPQGGTVDGQSVSAYACYSPAWSPYFPGHLLRGSLRIGMPRSGERQLTYRESIAGTEVEFSGPVEGAGQILCAMLRTPGYPLPLFFSFYQPGTPASALVGIMAGNTYLAQEARPTSCRFVAIQVPQAEVLDAGNRYFAPSHGAVAQDLSALGLPGHAAAEAEAAVLAALHDGTAIDQIAFTEQIRVAEPVDRGWLQERDTRRGVGSCPDSR